VVEREVKKVDISMVTLIIMVDKMGNPEVVKKSLGAAILKTSH